MNKYISSFALLAFVICLTPQVANAYKTTGQTAVKLTPTTAFYTISYVFGSPSRDTYMPIHTMRDGSNSSDPLTLGYEILEDKKTQTDVGETAAIVLSNAKIVGKNYFIPAGSATKFTLINFFKTDADTPENDYALHVTGLPFTQYNQDNVEINSKLNKYELSYYQTDEVGLND